MLRKELIGKVIQCHIDMDDPETFVIGQLVFFDEDWFLMQDISPKGTWNGLALYLTSDLVSIHEDSLYLERIHKLLKHWGGRVPDVPLIGGKILFELISHAKEMVSMIGCELCASGYRDINGIVINADEHNLEIEQYDEFGRPDGKSYIDLSAITRLFIDDEESVCLNVLRKG